MKRVAFCLRLRPGAEQAYDKAHREVWPEMLSLLQRAGVMEYSIFRRGLLLVLSMHIAEDFEQIWSRIEQDPVNTRWQQAMAPFFDEMEALAPGERFPMMEEIFYMSAKGSQ